MLSFPLILDHMHSTEKLVRSSDQVLLLDIPESFNAIISFDIGSYA